MDKWRKIPQWIAGIFFVSALSGILIVGGLVKISSSETATPVLTGVFKEVLHNTEIARKFGEIQPFLKAVPPDKPLPLPGMEQFDIKTGEAVKLNPDELIERIASEAAEKFYIGKLEIPVDLGIEQEQFNPLSSVFSNGAHKSFVDISKILLMLALISGAGMVFFSRRFGRLAALGMGLIGGAAFPLILYSFAGAKIATADKLGSSASKEIQLLAPIVKQAAPAISAAQKEALLIMIVGSVFLLTGTAAGIIIKKK